MGAIQILPDYQYIIDERMGINDRLFKKIETNQDLILINDLINHHIRIDGHVLILEEMIVDLQRRLMLSSKIYEELLQEYGKLSEREMSMIKWILKKRNEQPRSKK